MPSRDIEVNPDDQGSALPIHSFAGSLTFAATSVVESSDFKPIRGSSPLGLRVVFYDDDNIENVVVVVRTARGSQRRCGGGIDWSTSHSLGRATGQKPRRWDAKMGDHTLVEPEDTKEREESLFSVIYFALYT